MNENIWRAVFWGNEAEAFDRIEELDLAFAFTNDLRGHLGTASAASASTAAAKAAASTATAESVATATAESVTATTKAASGSTATAEAISAATGCTAATAVVAKPFKPVASAASAITAPSFIETHAPYVFPCSSALFPSNFDHRTRGTEAADTLESVSRLRI